MSTDKPIHKAIHEAHFRYVQELSAINKELEELTARRKAAKKKTTHASLGKEFGISPKHVQRILSKRLN